MLSLICEMVQWYNNVCIFLRSTCGYNTIYIHNVLLSMSHIKGNIREGRGIYINRSEFGDLINRGGVGQGVGSGGGGLIPLIRLLSLLISQIIWDCSVLTLRVMSSDSCYCKVYRQARRYT